MSRRKDESIGAAVKRTSPVSRYAIEKATVKPKNLSDVAWRIELRRRAKASYFSQFGVVVP